jgi:hypothetical protein
MEREALRQQIVRLIEKHELKKEDRHRDYLYPRYFLMWVLVKKCRLSLQATGDHFDKDHSTVIHGIKMHDIFTDSRDSIYEYYIREFRSALEVPEEIRTLQDDVLKCRSFGELKVIKKRIKEGFYL